MDLKANHLHGVTYLYTRDKACYFLFFQCYPSFSTGSTIPVSKVINKKGLIVSVGSGRNLLLVHTEHFYHFITRQLKVCQHVKLEVNVL